MNEKQINVLRAIYEDTKTLRSIIEQLQKDIDENLAIILLRQNRRKWRRVWKNESGIHIKIKWKAQVY